METYIEVSLRIKEIALRFTPQVEVFSVDEMFMDVTGTERLWGDAWEVARQFRRMVFEETGVCCSAGISYNKLVAKVCCDTMAKKAPEGIYEWKPEHIEREMHPLPVRELFGVGSRMEHHFQSRGIVTIGDLAHYPLHLLKKRFGIMGEVYHLSANGIDYSPVTPRNGNIVTPKFPELREVTADIKAHSAIIDCEGICMRDGRPIFDDFAERGMLTNPMKITAAVRTHPATFVAFDVLTTDRDHINETLTDRRKRLQELIDPSGTLMPTMYVEGQGKALHALTEERELEGIVAKKKASRYQLDTRSADWLKMKHFKQFDVQILGYRLEPQFGLVVGLNFRTIKNKPVAVVEFGFKPEEKRAFLAIAKQIHIRKEKLTQWIEPRLCCRIQYLERTERHHLRITSFKGFLFDKHSDDCRWVR